MQFVLFTDNLQSLPVAQLCAEAKKLGFDGLDLTLRPGGHVEPENAEAGERIGSSLCTAKVSVL